MDALAGKDKTVEFVKTKLEFEFKKKHSESENSRSNAFTFEKRKEDKRTCYVCGNSGHIQYDCPKKNNSWNQGSPQQGGGRGSRAPQRGGGNGRGYTQQRGMSSNRRGRSGYRQRGRGARGSDDNSRGHQNTEKSEVLSTSVEIRSANISNGNINENKIEWILDSGCTDHVINNQNYFNDAIVLKEPINVKVGDGRILKATKVGHVKSKFKTFNEEIDLELENVFYVKDIDRKLMRFAKVTDKCKVVCIGDSAKIYNKNNKLIEIAWKKDRMYKMTSFIEKSKESNLIIKNEKMTLKEKWHRTLGHVFEPLSNLARIYISRGMSPYFSLLHPLLRLHLPFVAVRVWSGGFRARSFTVQGSIKPPGGRVFALFLGDDAFGKRFRAPSRAPVHCDHVFFFSNLPTTPYNVKLSVGL